MHTNLTVDVCFDVEPIQIAFRSSPSSCSALGAARMLKLDRLDCTFPPASNPKHLQCSSSNNSKQVGQSKSHPATLLCGEKEEK